MARIFDGYEEVKRAQGRMDMEDVLLLTAGLLAEDERVAAQVRRQYKWFVVDEFQDVSPLQSALLDLWLGGRDELCVVGDPAQTIYSFAGANADYLRDFPSQAPRAPPRSSWSATTARPRRSSRPPTGCSPAPPSQGVALRAQRPSGAAVEFHERSDEVAEATAVAAQIAALRQSGRALAEMAVLFRINAQSENFEEALSGRGIPYVIRGAARFFDRPEVREAVTRIRGAARSRRGGRRRRHRPRHARRDGLDRRAARRARPDPGPVGVLAGADGPGRRVRVDAARSGTGRRRSLLEAFVDDLDRRAAEQHAPVAEGVTLATFHAAKGLEWDSVFLCGLQDGTLPITYAETPAAIEEERRLLYVGMTRARHELSLSWSLARQPGGRGSRGHRASSARCCPTRCSRPPRPAAAAPSAGRAPAASAARR